VAGWQHASQSEQNARAPQSMCERLVSNAQPEGERDHVGRQAGILPAYLSVLAELRGTLNAFSAMRGLLINQAAHSRFETSRDL
jgi:hypothetical protein